MHTFKPVGSPQPEPPARMSASVRSLLSQQLAHTRTQLANPRTPDWRRATV
jgi:hypothetical protein